MVLTLLPTPCTILNLAPERNAPLCERHTGVAKVIFYNNVTVRKRARLDALQVAALCGAQIDLPKETRPPAGGFK